MGSRNREKVLNVHDNQGINKAKCHQMERGGNLFLGQVACEPSSSAGSFLVPSTAPLRLCCTRVASRRPDSRAGMARPQDTN